MCKRKIVKKKKITASGVIFSMFVSVEIHPGCDLPKTIKLVIAAKHATFRTGLLEVMIMCLRGATCQ